MLTTVAALRAAARAAPANTVVWAPAGAPRVRWTLEQLLEVAVRLAHVLAARVPVGQALGVQAPSSDVWLIFQHAAALAGIRIVAIPPSLPPRPIEAIVRRTRCMTVVRERELLGLLEAVSEPQRLADVEENAIAQVQLTSCGEQPSRRAGRLAIAVAASTSRNSAAMASPSTARVASGSTASSANRGILDTLALCPHATFAGDAAAGA